MTYKYSQVRREIYACTSAQTIRKYRSLKEIKKLFRWYFWLLLAIVIAAMISYFLLIVFLPSTFYWLIPIPFIIALPCILEIYSEKFYKPTARQNDLNEYNAHYNQYINNIKQVFTTCGINTPDKEKLIKSECLSRMDKHGKPFAAAKKTAYSFLIGTPLTVLISTIIKPEDTPSISLIIGVIAFGIIAIAFLSVLKLFYYYADGYFKDKRLLETLNELEYHHDS